MSGIWKRSKILKNIHFLKLAAFFALYCSSQCVAQESLENSVRTLSEKTEVVITEGTHLVPGNIESFQPLLPPEVLPLIQKSVVDFELKPSRSKKPALPTAAPTAQDLLLATQATIQSASVLLYNFNLHSFKERASDWSVQGSLARVYPSSLESHGNQDQLFREKISLAGPRSVADYTWLTFRFSGSDEDLVWIYSPLIKKDRQVASSLRTDPLFHSILSSEDIFTWSGKPQAADARILGRAEFLLPAIEKIDVANSSTENCTTNTTVIPAFQQLSAQKAAAPKAPLLLTAKETLTPYTAWRVELINKDPYSLYGKQILYIDAASHLPLLKIVHDRKGVPWKVIYSSFLRSIRTQQDLQYWYRKTTAHDLQKRETVVFEVTSGTVCSTYTPDITLKDFDPTQLGQKSVPTKPSPVSG